MIANSQVVRVRQPRWKPTQLRIENYARAFQHATGRDRAPQDPNFLSVAPPDESSMSSTSTISKIIDGYVYNPDSPSFETVRKSQFGLPKYYPQEEKRDLAPVDDMIRAIDRALTGADMDSPTIPGFRAQDLNRPRAGVARDTRVAATPSETENSRRDEGRRLKEGALRVGMLGKPLPRIPRRLDTQVQPNPAPAVVLDSPIDWKGLGLPGSPEEPESAVSCITDAFSEGTNWSDLRSGDDSDYERGYGDDDDWESTCGHTVLPYSPDEFGSYDATCGTMDTTTTGATMATEVTNIDDASQIGIGQTHSQTDLSHEDFGKEAVSLMPVSPLVTCRIESVALLDFPEYLPNDEEEQMEFQRRSMWESMFSDDSTEVGSIPIAPPPSIELPATGRDAMSISRQAMKQDWTETPPMKLDMEKFDSMPPARTGTPQSSRSSPVPSSRSVTPRQNQLLEAKPKNTEQASTNTVRSRTPKGWRLW